jgi:hypothetical protein
MQEPRQSDYFQRRAEEERAAAERATNERAAHSHRELSEQYRKLAGGAEPPVHDSGDRGGGILPKEFRIVP